MKLDATILIALALARSALAKSPLSSQILNGEPDLPIEAQSAEQEQEMKNLVELVGSVIPEGHIDLGIDAVNSDGVSKSDRPVDREEFIPHLVVDQNTASTEIITSSEVIPQYPEASSQVSASESLDDNFRAAECPEKVERLVILTTTSTQTVEEQISTIFVHTVHTLTVDSRVMPTPLAEQLSLVSSMVLLPSFQPQPLSLPQPLQNSGTHVTPPQLPQPQGPVAKSEGSTILPSNIAANGNIELQTIPLTADSFRRMFKDALLGLISELTQKADGGESEEASNDSSDPGQSSISSVVTPPSPPLTAQLAKDAGDLDMNDLKSLIKNVMQSNEIPVTENVLPAPSVDFQPFEKGDDPMTRPSSDDKQKMRALGLGDKDFSPVKTHTDYLSVDILKDALSDVVGDFVKFIKSKDKHQAIDDWRQRPSVKDAGLEVTNAEVAETLEEQQSAEIIGFEDLKRQLDAHLTENPIEPADRDEQSKVQGAGSIPRSELSISEKDLLQEVTPDLNINDQGKKTDGFSSLGEKFSLEPSNKGKSDTEDGDILALSSVAASSRNSTNSSSGPRVLIYGPDAGKNEMIPSKKAALSDTENRAGKSDNHDRYMTTLARESSNEAGGDSKSSRHEFLEKVKSNPSSLFQKHNGAHAGEKEEQHHSGFFDFASAASEGWKFKALQALLYGCALFVFISVLIV